MKKISRRQIITAAAGSFALASPLRAIEPIHRKGRQRMHLSLAAYSMRNQLRAKPGTPGAMDLGAFVDWASGLDIDAVELTAYFFPETPTDAYLASLRRRCHLHGLDVSGGAIGNNFTVDPGSKLDEQMAYTKQWIDVYAKLGAPVIRVFAGKPPKGVGEEDGIARAVKNLRIACEYAGRRGVMLAIENHDYLTRVDRLIAVVKQIDSPWFGVNLDSGNIHDADPYGALEKIAPYAINAQIKVNMPKPAGQTGHEPTDLPRVIGILREAGYSGYVVLEYEDKADPFVAVPRYLGELRKAIG